MAHNKRAARAIRAITDEKHEGVIQQFADQAGLGRSTMSRIMSGERQLQIDQAEKILRSLDDEDVPAFLKAVVEDYFGKKAAELVVVLPVTA